MAFLLPAVVWVAVGCGRTQISPWGATGDAGLPQDAAASRDGTPDLPGDGAPDGAVPDGGDAETSPLSCGSLAALIARGPLTARHARQALFTANGRALLLRVAGQASSSDEVLRVALPGGDVTALVPGVTASEWLGNTGRLLLTRANGGALTALAVDGSFVRTLLGGSCEHVSSPDGSRVYALHDCDGDRGPGVLVAIDVQTGQTTSLSAAAGRGTLVVSPDSQWAAYETGPTADGGAAGIHVVARGGADYPLDLRVGARRPGFTPTGALLFLTTADAAPLAVADIYRHVPGTGGSAVRVAQSRNVGTGGYHVSPDGTLLLAARFPPASLMLNELYAVRLDGSGETLVASNLAPYQMTSPGVSAFAFSADGRRVVYVSNNFSGTATVSVAGGMITPLANGGTFAISPRGDWTAVIDPMNATKEIDTVHADRGPHGRRDGHVRRVRDPGAHVSPRRARSALRRKAPGRAPAVVSVQRRLGSDRDPGGVDHVAVLDVGPHLRRAAAVRRLPNRPNRLLRGRRQRGGHKPRAAALDECRPDRASGLGPRARDVMRPAVV